MIRIVLLLCSFFVAACASPSGKQRLQEAQSKNRARAAAQTVGDFFVYSHDPEERSVQQLEFYFKNCTLVGRSAYPSRSEYECTGPR